MFGLEKKRKPPFEFDLEKDLRHNKKKCKEVLVTIEQRMEDLKKELREGSESENFEQLGILLHGYTALHKVIDKLSKEK